MLGLGNAVMRGMALGFDLPETYFQPFYDRSFWCMRIIRYGRHKQPHWHHISCLRSNRKSQIVGPEWSALLCLCLRASVCLCVYD